MRVAQAALIFVYGVLMSPNLEKNSNLTRLVPTCEWCGRKIENDYEFVASVHTEDGSASYSIQWICRACAITAANALELAKQVTQAIKEGGKQLYIAVEKSGEEGELLSVKRWSPLEPLQPVDNAERNLHTFQLPQEQFRSFVQLDAERNLIGTQWRKVKGRHWGQIAQIEAVSIRGPKLRFIGRAKESTHLSIQQFLRIGWNELGRVWVPNNNEAVTAYRVWLQEKDEMKVTTDAQGFVEKVEREDRKMIDEELKMVACQSSYHNPRNDLVPEAQSRITRKGKVMCNECTQKMREYSQKRKTEKSILTKEEAVALREEQNQHPSPFDMPAWSIDVVQVTHHIVHAKDYLDAAAHFDGKGEIIRITKI